MPIVRSANELSTTEGDGYTETACAGSEIFGAPVPMQARRFVVRPGATAPVDVAGDEAMVYVVTGTGVLEAGPERHDLAPESLVWLEPPASTVVHAGDGGVEVLVAEAPGR